MKYAALYTLIFSSYIFGFQPPADLDPLNNNVDWSNPISMDVFNTQMSDWHQVMMEQRESVQKFKKRRASLKKIKKSAEARRPAKMRR